jgi:hypothetical protein
MMRSTVDPFTRTFSLFLAPPIYFNLILFIRSSSFRPRYLSIYPSITDSGDACRMLLVDRCLLCLMPINVAFGFSAGFLYSYFYQHTVARFRGDSAVRFVHLHSHLHTTPHHTAPHHIPRVLRTRPLTTHLIYT